MGVDTTIGRIPKQTTKEELLKFLGETYPKAVVVGSSPNHLEISFGTPRRLWCIWDGYPTREKDKPWALLEMGCYEKDSVGIIKGIVEHFGGDLDENDSDDIGPYTITKTDA